MKASFFVTLPEKETVALVDLKGKQNCALQQPDNFEAFGHIDADILGLASGLRCLVFVVALFRISRFYNKCMFLLSLCANLGFGNGLCCRPH